MTTRYSRRAFLGSVPALAALPQVSAAAGAAPRLPLGQPELGLRITGMELIVVRATARTNWIFVRLSTNDGMTGLGEASMGRLTDLAGARTSSSSSSATAPRSKSSVTGSRAGRARPAATAGWPPRSARSSRRSGTWSARPCRRRPTT